MDADTKLLAAAERLFDRHGFTATGMDRLTAAAGMSSRTLYKHVGSKAALMAAVLTERGQRFLQQIDVPDVDTLFTALEAWMRTEGARGCLFLRALGETGGDLPQVADAVAVHKTAFRQRIARIVAADLGRPDADLAEQVLVLFEGATAAAIHRGLAAVAAARAAAAAVMAQARS